MQKTIEDTEAENLTLLEELEIKLCIL